MKKKFKREILTKGELKVLDLSAKLWNAFSELPDQHPADLPETQVDIHHIQNRVVARLVKRTHPDIFYASDDKDDFDDRPKPGFRRRCKI